jgi:hypothetical protein
MRRGWNRLLPTGLGIVIGSTIDRSIDRVDVASRTPPAGTFGIILRELSPHPEPQPSSSSSSSSRTIRRRRRRRTCFRAQGSTAAEGDIGRHQRQEDRRVDDRLPRATGWARRLYHHPVPPPRFPSVIVIDDSIVVHQACWRTTGDSDQRAAHQPIASCRDRLCCFVFAACCCWLLAAGCCCHGLLVPSMHRRSSELHRHSEPDPPQDAMKSIAKISKCEATPACLLCGSGTTKISSLSGVHGRCRSVASTSNRFGTDDARGEPVLTTTTLQRHFT